MPFIIAGGARLGDMIMDSMQNLALRLPDTYECFTS